MYIFVLCNVPFLILYLWVLRQTRDFFNPLTVPFFFYTVPSVIATFKLSNLQIDFSLQVLMIMWVTSFIFMAFPAYFIAMKNKKQNLSFDNEPTVKNSIITDNKASIKLLAVIAVLYVFNFLLENYLLFKTLFPISKAGSEFFGEHFANIPIIGYINTVLKYLLPLIIGLRYYKTKDKRYLLLFALVTFVPLTRMQRSPVMGNIIIFLLILMKSKLPKFKTLLISIFSILAMGIIFSWVSYLRIGSTFYSSLIGLKSTNIFTDMINIYYGYYCFSFDTLQRSFDNWVSSGMPTYKGIGVLSGLYSFLQMDTFIPQLNSPYDIIMSQRVYLNGATVLPTAIHEFLLDFGIVGAVVFMFLLMLLYVNFYFKYEKSQSHMMLYIVFSYLLTYLAYYSPFMNLGLTALIIYAVGIYIFKGIFKKDVKIVFAKK